MALDKSALFILTYFAAILPAIGFLYFNRRKKKTKLLAVLRVLFNPKTWLCRSSLVDFGYLFAGVLIFPSLFAYTTISGAWLSEQLNQQLTGAFGARAPLHSNIFYTMLMGATIYVAYEFAYWLNHYLSHKIRFLWEFHKVHHAATVLTPVTVWRVHVMDTILFANMTVATVGIAQGVISYLLGHEISLAAASASNALLYGFLMLYGHLQHSQIWIPFTGKIGHVFFSPAHHQIHHSKNAKHFNKNFGSSLAIFDWMFGTLCMPAHEDECLVLGVDGDKNLTGFVNSNVYPFIAAWKHVRRAAMKMWGGISPSPAPIKDLQRS